jgi:F-type H+-transporting ATPase subunit b
LEEKERDTVEEFLRDQEQIVTVRSAYEIPEEYRTKIRVSLADRAGFDVRVKFEVEEDLICGIVLSAKNVEISWSIAGYLESLEADFSRWLEKRTLTQSVAK